MSTAVYAPIAGPASVSVTPRTVPTVFWGVVVAVTLAFAPQLIWYGLKLWLKPHYQFFPLVLVGSAALLYPALVAISRDPKVNDSSLATPVAGIGWFVLLLGIAAASPWLSAVAFWLVLASVPLAVAGWPGLRACLPALVYPLLVIHPPFGLDLKLVGGLQWVTSNASSIYLDRLGVFHYLSGNTVQIGDENYFVEEACSGINSLLSTLAVTLFYIFMVKMRPVRAILLGLACVFWVVVSNTARVFLIVFLHTRFNFDLRSGWKHETLGFLLFAISLLMIASSNRFFAFLLGGDDRRTVFDGLPKPLAFLKTWSLRPRGWLVAPASIAMFGLLALLAVGDLPTLIGNAYYGTALAERYKGFDRDTLPERVGPWIRVGQEPKVRDSGDAFGQYSSIWTYQNGAVSAIVSFDYPFPEWHDLRQCYKAVGWTLDTAKTSTQKREQDGESEPLIWTDAQMVKQVDGEPGYLCFTVFDQSGHYLNGEGVFDNTELLVRCKQRVKDLQLGWKRLFHRGGQGSSAGVCLQVEVVTQSAVPLTPEQRVQTKQLFFLASETIRKRCLAIETGSK